MAFLPIIGPVFDVVNTVLKRVLPAERMSEAERAKLEAEMARELMSADWQATLAQVQVNLQEAKHESRFIAGWRPYIGWVCGTGLAYHFIAQPLATWVITVLRWQAPPLPVFDLTQLVTILLGMLGLGGLRTYEKLRGANTNR